MPQMFRMFAVCLALVAAFRLSVATGEDGAAAAPQTVRLVLKPVKGDEFEMRLHRVKKIALWNVESGKVTRKRLQASSLDMKLRYTVRVVAAEPSTELEVEFTSSAGTIETVMGPYSWDSAKGVVLPEDWTVARRIVVPVALAGVKVTASLDASGRVTHTKGLGEAVAKALAGVEMPAHVRDQKPPEAELAATLQSFLPAPPPGTWTAGVPRDEDATVDADQFTVRRTLAAVTEKAATIDETWKYVPPERDEFERSEVVLDEAGGRGSTVWSRTGGWMDRRSVAIEHRFANKYGHHEETVVSETFERVPLPARRAKPAK